MSIIIRLFLLIATTLAPTGGILKGKLVQPINRETIQQYVASGDIGKAASKYFRIAICI
jgi:hypothetical protein